MSQPMTAVPPAPPPAPVPHHDEDQVELPAAPTPRARTLVATLVGILITLGVLFAAGLAPRVVKARDWPARRARRSAGYRG